MVADSTAQIRDEFGLKKCQAFDAMMLVENKAEQLIEGAKRLSTSCVAPSYAYIDGSHGKKFLCDFHYIFEYYTERDYSVSGSHHVFENVVKDFEKIKETFGPLPDAPKPQAIYCWCGQEPFVFLHSKEVGNLMDSFCNFHYRKFLYRSLSNGIDIHEQYDIMDYRLLLKKTIEEEFKTIGQI